MKKQAAVFLLAFLLSISTLGCAYSAIGAPEASENLKTDIEPNRNFYKINGVLRDIGDYQKFENLFLSNYIENNFSNLGVQEDDVFLYDVSELTAEILENRIGTVVIERCIGLVTDCHTGDGAILNINSNYNYIAYRDINQKISDGTVILTYLVYNPDDNYVDDIIERFDFVICREYED